MNQIERINLMENYLDESAQFMEDFAAALEDYRIIQYKLRDLADYYISDDWRRDFNDLNRGKFPEDMKHAVLSEGTVYNLLSENHKLQVKVLEVMAEILREGRF